MQSPVLPWRPKYPKERRLMMSQNFCLLVLLSIIPFTTSFSVAPIPVVRTNRDRAVSFQRPVMQCVPGGEKFTGVRFSLYPKGEHIKDVIKGAMANITSLGLVSKPDDVSTVLIGDESNLFEAVRVAFGRCCADGRHVSMQATFSSGCPGESPIEQAPRTVPAELTVQQEDGWLRDAVHPLRGTRVAAQVALYPLGLPNYMDIIYREIAQLKASGVYKGQKTHFCSMLDGDGDEVFKALRQCFDNARKDGGHVVMTVTAMTNKRAWQDKK